MSADEARAVRLALSAAMNRQLSQREFGVMLGLAPAGADRTIRNWEKDGPTGPGALALHYMAQGLPGFRDRIPEWSWALIDGNGETKSVVSRHWWPRFVGTVGTVGPRLDAAPAYLDVVHWIDEPGEQREAVLQATCRALDLLLRPVAPSPA